MRGIFRKPSTRESCSLRIWAWKLIKRLVLSWTQRDFMLSLRDILSLCRLVSKQMSLPLIIALWGRAFKVPATWKRHCKSIGQHLSCSLRTKQCLTTSGAACWNAVITMKPSSTLMSFWLFCKPKVTSPKKKRKSIGLNVQSSLLCPAAASRMN